MKSQKLLSLILVTLLCSILFFSPASAESLSSPLYASGDFVWATGLGGIGNDSGDGIITDTNGNSYVVGEFQNIVDFDPGVGTVNLTSAGNTDGFITKLDSNGALVWVKQFGSTLADRAVVIRFDSNNDLYITGFFRGTVDFDPGAGTANKTSNGDSDIFLLKLNNSGDFVWVKSFGSAQHDMGVDLTLDSTNNIYLLSDFIGTVDFDPGAAIYNLTSNSASYYDVAVTKLDGNGDFIWAKGFGSTSEEYGGGIIINSSGNVYVAGSFDGTVDFDPGVGTFNLTSNFYDMFVLALDVNGSFIWAISAGSSGVEEGNSIAVDTADNIYIVGDFEGTVDFNPRSDTYYLSSNGLWDSYILKLDNLGNFMWAKSIGGTGDDAARKIVLDSNNNLYVGGFFSNAVDFDPGTGTYNLTSSGSYDAYAVKLKSNSSFIWARGMGGSSNDIAFDIALDSSNNNVYITGNFTGTADFDPGANTSSLTSAGVTDIFISKLDAGIPPSGATDIDITIAGTSQGTYPMTPETSQVVQYTLDGGPVVISSNNGVGIIASLNQWRRPTPYGGWTGVAQSMALPMEQISSSYVIPRYNGTDPTLYNAVLMANVDNVPRTITVKIGGVTMGSYDLGPSDSRFEVYNVTGGPLVVSSVTGAKIVASLYELKRAGDSGEYNGQSEMMGLPSSQLSDKVLIPIYFGMWGNYLNASLYFANADTFATTVDVKIAGVSRGTYPMPPNTSMVVQYTLDGGPVEISSNNGAKVVASLNQWRRPTPYGGWTGVAQSMALPMEQISNSYVIPRYNGADPTLYNAVLMANVDNVPRTITVTIGGVVMGSYNLGPSDSRFEVYNVTAGPVIVSSDMGSKIVASLYELKRAGDTGEYNGQSEMMGLTMTQLSDKYLIPIYFGNWGNYLNASLYIGVP